MLFLAGAVYSGLRFFAAAETKTKILYATVFLACFYGMGLMKIFAFEGSLDEAGPRACLMDMIQISVANRATTPNAIEKPADRKGMLELTEDGSGGRNQLPGALGTDRTTQLQAIPDEAGRQWRRTKPAMAASCVVGERTFLSQRCANSIVEKSKPNKSNHHDKDSRILPSAYSSCLHQASTFWSVTCMRRQAGNRRRNCYPAVLPKN